MTTTITLYRAYTAMMNAHDNYKNVNPWIANDYLQVACKIYEMFIESDREDLKAMMGH